MMKHIISLFIAVLALISTLLVSTLIMSTQGWANAYAPRMDVAEWKVEASPFYCKMTQPIPNYGLGVFERRAGESVGFYLYNEQEYMAAGKALVQSQAPLWQPERAVRSLGYVSVLRREQSIKLNEELALSMLDELYRGMTLDFKREGWYEKEKMINVGLSPVHFQVAYRAYTDCLAQLLPVNFEQIARTTVHFETANQEMTEESRIRLQHIAAYLKADPTVGALFVDGHTDNRGEREKNLELSRKRAESVTNFLILSGIKADRFTTRFHGERYPIASNGTAKGREKNRRVTIRIERDKALGLVGGGAESLSDF